MYYYDKAYCRLYFRFFVFLFTCYQVVGSDLTEEGWRYHGSLKVKIKADGCEPLECDFSEDHNAMAKVLQSQTNTEQYSSIVRFTPVYKRDSKVTTGKIIRLLYPHDDGKNMQLLPLFEVGFVSGFCDHTIGDVLWRYKTSVYVELSDTSKPNILSLLPAFHKEKKDLVQNSIAVRFCQRNYINPQLFEKQLEFRYPDKPDNTILARGNYKPLLETHTQTKRQLMERSNFLQRAFAEINTQVILDDFEEVLSADKRDLLKKESRKFNNNSAANSYTCAEQAALDYLYSESVIKYLKNCLLQQSHNGELVGLIVHSHCSHTPCTTCATSFSSELEKDGVFRKIANNKPVFMICSCQNHYERKPPMLTYEKTLYCSANGETTLDQESSFDLSSSDRTPYPVILLKYDPNQDSFAVELQKIKSMQSSQKERLSAVVSTNDK